MKPTTFHVYDSDLGVWHDQVDESVSMSTMQSLLAVLERHGWTITSDPKVDRDYPLIAKAFRYGRRGRMQYELAALSRACLALGFVDTTARRLPDADAELDRRRAADTAWRGRALKPDEYGNKDRDGARLSDGVVRYYRDHHGHLRRGVVRHNINNMWWVVESRDRFTNKAAFELFTFDPARDRLRRDMRELALSRVEGALKRAVKAEHFERAATLRDVRNRMTAEAAQ